MHSSQMYTPPGPAIRRWTCSWLLPQKEQRYCTRGVLVPAIYLIASCLRLRVSVAGGRVRTGLFGDDMINQTVLLSLLGGEEAVALEVGSQRFDGLPRMVRKYIKVAGLETKQLAGVNLDVGGGSGQASADERRVVVDGGVGQAVPLAVSAGR